MYSAFSLFNKFSINLFFRHCNLKSYISILEVICSSKKGNKNPQTNYSKLRHVLTHLDWFINVNLYFKSK